MKQDDVLRLTTKGLYCPAGNFYIDPWRPVEHAVITHGHSDHGRPGSAQYYCCEDSVGILKLRLGRKTIVKAAAYRQQFRLGNALLSFHPAGHILGSAQVRVEVDGKVWVVSGDYKVDEDPTCQPIEAIECDTFISEATFGLPIFRWPKTRQVCQELFDFHRQMIKEGRPTLIFCYALGKAQRLMAELRHFTDEPFYLHGAMTPLTDLYKEHEIELGETIPVSSLERSHDFKGKMIFAPPSAHRSPWMKRFKGAGTGFASGWMQTRANKRRRGYDRGFVVSDHADFWGLVKTIRQTKAKRVLVTHGYSETLACYLCEQGINAEALETAFAGEVDQ